MESHMPQLSPLPATNAPRQHRKRCSFFNTPQGCRRGNECTFAHNLSLSPPSSPATPFNPGQPKSSRRGQSRPSVGGQNDQITTSSSIGHRVDDSDPGFAEPSTAPQPHQPFRQARPINPARAPVRKPLPKSLAAIDSLTLKEQHRRLREFELNQVKSRFGSSVSFEDMTTLTANETVWRFSVVPTDPDFPYEIDALEINLHVPNPYPEEPAWLEVLNSNIPKGFGRNLEKGFSEHAITAITAGKSLLSQLSWLDINMETLLQQPPAPTIRFVRHATPAADPTQLHKPQPPPLPMPLSRPMQSPNPSWTTLERQEASLKRQQQITQLQARFRGSLKLLSPTSVVIALEPTRSAQLPIQWQGPLMIQMHIPTLYPLEPCSIQLGYNGANPEFEDWRVTNIEKGFEKIVEATPGSLFQHLNQLNRDLKDLMLLPQPQLSTSTSPCFEPLDQPRLRDKGNDTQLQFSPPLLPSSESHPHDGMPCLPLSMLDTSKTGRRLYHIKKPLPHNFEAQEGNGTYTSEDTGDDSEIDYKELGDEAEENTEGESEYPTEKDEGGDSHEQANTALTETGPPKRGVEIRTPGIVLEHISLLQCNLLNLLVRCNRCKAIVEIPNLNPDRQQDSHSSLSNDAEYGPDSTSSTIKRQKASKDKQTWKNCDTCLSPLGAHFRPEFVHMQSRTLGYLDLAGCTAFDLLPSTFIPTCDGCDQVLGSDVPGGVIGFRQQVGRGMSAAANCRHCHLRLVFVLEGEVRFIKLAPGDLLQANAQILERLPLKKKKGKGGTLVTKYEEAIKIGEPLPKKGACEHYKKSRRWFRFPCCSKIYPCHLCHDEKETSHEAEYAKRMVCGNCAREQPVSDKLCQCGQSPVKSSRPASAFWEGGEGIRDKTRMSTKDSRKHKGVSKTVAKKQVGTENVRKRNEKSKKT